MKNKMSFADRGFHTYRSHVCSQCDQKKISPNIYKSCPKMIALKMIDFDTFTKIA